MKKEKLGQRLYKYINGQLFICRLLKVKSDNCFVVLDENNNNARVNLTKAQYDSYTKLRENGIVVFSTVGLTSATTNPLTGKKEENTVPDVIVSLFRREDITKGKPYAVCRQNAFDIFNNAIENDGGMMYIGCSISQDTCPENIDFNMFYACSEVNHSDIVAIYYDDTLDTILSFLKSTEPYDSVLALLKEGFDDSKVRGTQSTLKELLINNYFIEDIRRGFNIVKVNFTYKGNEKYNTEFIHAIEDIIKREMIAPVWTKYEYDIDLTKIMDDYVLVIDDANDIYIVSYKAGEYSNRPYMKLNDTTEVEALNRLV